MNVVGQNYGDNHSLLGQFKLRTQMVIFCTIFIVIFGGATAIVYNNANQVFELFSEAQVGQKVITEVDKISLYASNMDLNNRGYIISEMASFINSYQQNWQDFQKASNSLEGVISEPQQKGYFNQIKEVAKKYNEYANQIFDLIKNGKRQEAIEIFNTGVGTRALSNFLELNNQLSTLEMEKLSQENFQARNTLQKAVRLLIVGSVFAVVTVFVIPWLIFSFFRGKISLTFGKIGQVISSLNNSSLEIDVAVTQQEKSSNSQAVAVNEATTTMDELGSSAKQASQQAEAAQMEGQEVLKSLDNSNQLVEKTLGEMDKTKNKVKAISEQILRLSEQTNQIGTISQLVRDLANQTNMLALNAAVEAVRAGEYGKGFTVVSSEIRKLADESKRSADKIYALVEEIKQATNMSVMVTEEGLKSLEVTENLTQTTASSFVNMSTKVNNIVVNSQQISMTAREQNVAIQQLVIAMNILNQSFQENTGGMNQVRSGIQKINHVALELKEIVQEG